MDLPQNSVQKSPVWRERSSLQRFRSVCGEVAGQAIRNSASFLGFRSLVDRPRFQPLRTEHHALGKWRRSAYGTPAKPDSLKEINWDYVSKYQHEIPFLGLREYWYPVMRSKDLPNNKPVPQQVCGDSIVLFRDGLGKAAAIIDRCPHRGPMMSLGQVGVVEPGTITCRYHGMTFNRNGDCIAVTSDGPDSPACGTLKTRSYPVQEEAGLVWVYMGDKAPEPLLEAVPYLKEIIDGREMFIHKLPMNFSYLNTLDNSVDMSHPSCLHRTCLPFASQKVYVRVKYEDMPGNGVKAYIPDGGGNYDEKGDWHDGMMHIKESQWYPPNIAFFRPEAFGMAKLQGDDAEMGYFWAVPNTIGTSTGWLILSQPLFKNPLKRWFTRFLHNVLHGIFFKWPGSNLACIDHADAVMMETQGRIAEWDRDVLLRVDVATARVREIVKRLHRAEVKDNPKRADIVPAQYRAKRHQDSVPHQTQRRLAKVVRRTLIDNVSENK